MFKHSLAVLFFTLIAVFALDASAATVQLCRHASTGAYEYADNAGNTPASDAFQRCINDTSVAKLDLEPGIYLVDAPIVVRRPFRIGTAGLASDTRNCQQLPAGWCAEFFAWNSANACINDETKCVPSGRVKSGGLLQALNTTGVVLDHLIIDGNKSGRHGSISAGKCAYVDPATGASGNVYGFNATVNNCDTCQFTYNLTQNTLCGTGLQWFGDSGLIQGNAAFNNGIFSDANHKLWSDGMTILKNNNGTISDNHIVNSTDVGLIFGAANHATIQSNWIEQYGVYTFAAMMLGNFKEGGGAGQTGDYRDVLVRYNTINCYGLNCGIGLNLGPDPWSPLGVDYDNIFGGSVTRTSMISQNSINGARMAINFGGAGKPGQKITVTNNTLTNPPSGYTPLYPLPTGSPCANPGGFVQNLPNNNQDGEFGNYAIADPVATSALHFKECWPKPTQ